jgi:hypothetical protein
MWLPLAIQIKDGKNNSFPSLGLNVCLKGFSGSKAERKERVWGERRERERELQFLFYTHKPTLPSNLSPSYVS